MLSYDRAVRDPLYGYIPLTNEEVNILNTSPLQRLRRIQQLGFTQLVYPSAVHTRFEHSLGVLHIAGKIAAHLSLSDQETRVIRFAALLHDIGHGPFSHFYEQAIAESTGHSFLHEEITHALIQHCEEVSVTLKGSLEAVLSLFQPSRQCTGEQILNGPIDADKMDYLRRDSYHTGVAYGIFDLERLLYTLGVEQSSKESYLLIEEKGIDALDSFRLSRFFMHTQVYYHHTRVAAERMLGRGVKIAIDNGTLPRDLYTTLSEDMLQFHLSLDDASLIATLTRDLRSTSGQLAREVLNRRLLKRGYELNLSISTNARLNRKILSLHTFNPLEQAIAEMCRCDPDRIIGERHTIRNSQFSDPFKEGESDTLIRLKDGEIVHANEVSSLGGIGESRMMFYVFCPDKCRNEVRNITEQLIMDSF